MVNAQHGTASRNRKIKSGSDLSEDEVFESYHLPQAPDMPILGSGHPGLVSLTPHLFPQSVSFILCGIPNTETAGRTQTVRQRAGQRQALDLA